MKENHQFQKIRVKEVSKTTPECSIVELELEESQKKKFQFQHGQYLTFKTEIDGEEVRRSYSLCSSPLDDSWKIAVKQVEGGKFSTFVNQQLKKGDVLDVMPPSGRFFVPTQTKEAKKYVAFAAGSGITPILSIIKTHLLSEANSTFQLFYVNQSVRTIILKEELEALKNKFLNRFEIFHFLTREERNVSLFNGRIDREKLDIIFNHLIQKDQIDDIFICGPMEMVFLIRDYLKSINIDSKRVHFELFNTANSNPKKTIKRKIDTSQLSEITILEGGKTFRFSIPQASNNILDAALQRNADLPFACKGGVCATCRAKVIEGKVEMELCYALEEEEIKAGYILTCQAIPLSEKVTVDFDA